MDTFMVLWNTEWMTKRMILGDGNKTKTIEVNDDIVMPIWNTTVPHNDCT